MAKLLVAFDLLEAEEFSEVCRTSLISLKADPGQFHIREVKLEALQPPQHQERQVIRFRVPKPFLKYPVSHFVRNDAHFIYIIRPCIRLRILFFYFCYLSHPEGFQHLSATGDEENMLFESSLDRNYSVEESDYGGSHVFLEASLLQEPD